MSGAQTQRYKTLICGTLVQRTAFSVGGRDSHERVDSPVARDGRNRLTLRGSGIAGAFIATARRLIDGHLAASISSGPPGEQGAARGQAKREGRSLLRLPESLWRFHTSHPETEAELEVRSGVGIRQDTGAAAEGLKYEVETVPAGVRWPFLLEVDEYRDPDKTALPIALGVMEQWCELCLLGRNVARGLGWMKLDAESLRVMRLGSEDAILWPDSSMSPRDAFDALAMDGSRLLDAAELESIRKDSKVSFVPMARWLGTGTIRIDAAPEEAGTLWGLDSLSLGGSAAQDSLQDAALEPLTKRHPSEFDPDLTLAWTVRNGASRAKPFIPGSGLRGPLRHHLSWWLRSRESQRVHDPNTGEGRRALAAKSRGARDAIERLFGTGAYAGALLISDAHLSGEFADDAVLALEQHAEDEFTGGTFGEAKFNRLALVRGTFKFQFLVEADDAVQLIELRRLLAIAHDLGRARRVPIGGANWRGHGWVRWELQLPTDVEAAGEKASTPLGDAEEEDQR